MSYEVLWAFPLLIYTYVQKYFSTLFQTHQQKATKTQSQGQEENETGEDCDRL